MRVRDDSVNDNRSINLNKDLPACKTRRTSISACITYIIKNNQQYCFNVYKHIIMECRKYNKKDHT